MIRARLPLLCIIPLAWSCLSSASACAQAPPSPVDLEWLRGGVR